MVLVEIRKVLDVDWIVTLLNVLSKVFFLLNKQLDVLSFHTSNASLIQDDTLNFSYVVVFLTARVPFLKTQTDSISKEVVDTFIQGSSERTKHAIAAVLISCDERSVITSFFLVSTELDITHLRKDFGFLLFGYIRLANEIEIRCVHFDFFDFFYGFSDSDLNYETKRV